MNQKVLNYFKRSVIYTLGIFLFFVLLDAVLGYGFSWKDNLKQSLLMAFVVIPLAEWIVKKLKLN